MRVEGTYSFPVEPRHVLDALVQPQALRHLLPGCERLIQLGPTAADGTTEFEARLRLGPEGAVYTLRLHLTARAAVPRLRIVLRGYGPHGPLTATGQVDLLEREDETLAAYLWRVEATGLTVEQLRRLAEGGAADAARTLCARLAAFLSTQAPERLAAAAHPQRVWTRRGQIVRLPSGAARRSLALHLAPAAERMAWMGLGLVAGVSALGLLLAVARRLDAHDQA